MKKIVFNSTILSDKPNGISLYCKNILEVSKENLFYRIVFNSKFYNKTDNERVHTIKTESRFKLLNIFLRSFSFNRYVKKLSKDEDILLYSPTQHGINSRKIEQIITVHDLLPLLYPHGRIHQYIYYKYILPRVIKKSKAVITVSENTKQDIIKYYDTNPEKIHVIYNGFDKPKEINLEYSKEIVKEKYNVESYILMIGINYNYKNLHSIIRAYGELKEELNYSIIIAGNYDVGYGQELVALTKELSLQENVKFLGYIDDDIKHYLYQASLAFIYPSLYEGFGLPILEAMYNRTPVICSNTSSLPEVAGNAAIYIDSSNIENVKSALLRVNNMTIEERNNFIKKGIERAELFSWEKCVNDVESVIISTAKEG